MKIYNIIAAGLLLVLSSCYKEMPFRGMDTEPQLFFQCLPGAQDTTVFWLRATIPVNSDLVQKEVVNPLMTFKVNGHEADLQLNAGQSSTFPSDAYFTVVPLSAGDRLEFYAEAEGFKPISARTEIPQDIEDLTLSVDIIDAPNPDYYVAALDRWASQGLGESVTEFKVTFQDRPDVRDCYMVEVNQYVYHANGSILPYGKSVAYVVPKTDTDTFQQPQTDVLLANYASPWCAVETDRRGNDSLVMLFDDQEFDGQKLTKEIMVNRFVGSHDIKYMFRMYRVSEEFYKYVLAFDTAQQAEYSGFPSSTPFMSYNNIEGGSGIFAGVTVYDSGMFTVE